MRADLQQPRQVFADSLIRYKGQAYATMAELLGVVDGYDLNGWPLVDHNRLPVLSMRFEHGVGCTRRVDRQRNTQIVTGAPS